MIGEGERLVRFITSGVTEEEIAEIGRWPPGHGLLGLLIKEPGSMRLAGDLQAPGVLRLPAPPPADAALPGCAGPGARRGLRQPLPDREARRRGVRRGGRERRRRAGHRRRRRDRERPPLPGGPPAGAVAGGLRGGVHVAAVGHRPERGARAGGPAGAGDLPTPTWPCDAGRGRELRRSRSPTASTRTSCSAGAPPSTTSVAGPVFRGETFADPRRRHRGGAGR